MTRGSGDGFVEASRGGLRWGIYGAAGVLVRHRDTDGDWYFLARRSEYTHRGGSWGIPGGALDYGEEPLAGALREFAEEVGALAVTYEVAHTYVDDHGGWTYTTIVVDVAERFPVPRTLTWETAEAAWVPAAKLKELILFDAFEETLRKLGYMQ